MLYLKETSLGWIGVECQDRHVTRVSFCGDVVTEGEEFRVCGSGEEPGVITEAFAQIEAYLSGQLQEFSLSLRPEGTEFMRRVWSELLKIPFGQTVSYKDIALVLGDEKAVRAVGMANHRNPIPLFIPCHRVIGSDGKLVGYAGGLDIKRKLLELENMHAGLWEKR